MSARIGGDDRPSTAENSLHNFFRIKHYDFKLSKHQTTLLDNIPVSFVDIKSDVHKHLKIRSGWERKKEEHDDFV